MRVLTRLPNSLEASHISYRNLRFRVAQRFVDWVALNSAVLQDMNSTKTSLQERSQGTAETVMASAGVGLGLWACAISTTYGEGSGNLRKLRIMKPTV